VDIPQLARADGRADKKASLVELPYGTKQKKSVEARMSLDWRK
jgi:hypothetical protein